MVYLLAWQGLVCLDCMVAVFCCLPHLAAPVSTSIQRTGAAWHAQASALHVMTLRLLPDLDSQSLGCHIRACNEASIQHVTWRWPLARQKTKRCCACLRTRAPAAPSSPPPAPLLPGAAHAPSGPSARMAGIHVLHIRNLTGTSEDKGKTICFANYDLGRTQVRLCSSSPCV